MVQVQASRKQKEALVVENGDFIFESKNESVYQIINEIDCSSGFPTNGKTYTIVNISFASTVNPKIFQANSPLGVYLQFVDYCKREGVKKEDVHHLKRDEVMIGFSF